MQKETYIAIIERHQNRINRAKKAIEKLTKVYIEANTTFGKGDKIVITTPKHKAWQIFRGKDDQVFYIEESKRFAFIDSAELSYNNEVRYIIYKCKKDGTQSQQKDYYSDSDILTLAD